MTGLATHRHFSTVGALLKKADEQTSDLPECADIDESRKRVAEAFDDWERWAKTHKVWNAHSDKARMLRLTIFAAQYLVPVWGVLA